MLTPKELCLQAIQEASATPAEGLPKFPLRNRPTAADLEGLASNMEQHAYRMGHYASRLRSVAKRLPKPRSPRKSRLLLHYRRAMALYKAPNVFGPYSLVRKREASARDCLQLAEVLDGYADGLLESIGHLRELGGEMAEFADGRLEDERHPVAMEFARRLERADGEPS
ncbi:MAG: hypothetical protein IIB37_11105 [Gemmatimonadetes bacterium]|nr:hypothetical protein [Gemmatimonadota bacterium]MCH7935090.1 hypothetical protein [Gemmatimonadota bacterium]